MNNKPASGGSSGSSGPAKSALERPGMMRPPNKSPAHASASDDNDDEMGMHIACPRANARAEPARRGFGYWPSLGTHSADRHQIITEGGRVPQLFLSDVRGGA